MHVVLYGSAVPCATRVSALETSYAAETSVMMASDDGKEEEWLEPHARTRQQSHHSCVVFMLMRCMVMWMCAAHGEDVDGMGTISSSSTFHDDGVTVSKLKTSNLLAHVVENHAITAASGGAVSAPAVALDPPAPAAVPTVSDDDEYADMTDFTEDNLVVEDAVNIHISVFCLCIDLLWAL